jgi:hypothetical protein
MAVVTLRNRGGSFTGEVKHRRWGHGGAPVFPGLSPTREVPPGYHVHVHSSHRR